MKQQIQISVCVFFFNWINFVFSLNRIEKLEETSKQQKINTHHLRNKKTWTRSFKSLLLDTKKKHKLDEIFSGITLEKNIFILQVVLENDRHEAILKIDCNRNIFLKRCKMVFIMLWTPEILHRKCYHFLTK